jgi:biopolymer transport protein ExbB/TolQ
MNVCYLLAETQFEYVWGHAPREGKAILFTLMLFSIFAWTVMVSKAVQMRRAMKLNRLFESEFQKQTTVLAIFEKKIQVDGCPLFSVYQEGSVELAARLKRAESAGRPNRVTLKSMDHIKRVLEAAVAKQSLDLESGLILLAIAVSGAPFLGLLGTVWGVMRTFADVGMKGQADLPTMAPGVSAALVTTVAGLLVAIPSMFAYNWLVHNLRVLTVELDNFAQGLVSKIETEYVDDND